MKVVSVVIHTLDFTLLTKLPHVLFCLSAQNTF